MQDLDQQLLKEFRNQVLETGTGKFKNPGQPYEVSVEPSKAGHLITIIDTRKRWYGRTVLKHEHPLEAHSDIVDNGPVAAALTMLTLVIERQIPLG